MSIEWTPAQPESRFVFNVLAVTATGERRHFQMAVPEAAVAEARDFQRRRAEIRVRMNTQNNTRPDEFEEVEPAHNAAAPTDSALEALLAQQRENFARNMLDIMRPAIVAYMRQASLEHSASSTLPMPDEQQFTRFAAPAA
jgi:hypothetical protein